MRRGRKEEEGETGIERRRVIEIEREEERSKRDGDRERKRGRE